jgi:hypothetical protein
MSRALRRPARGSTTACGRRSMKTKTTKRTAAATPLLLASSDLAPVTGGIWGGPDGTWRCDGTRVPRARPIIID